MAGWNFPFKLICVFSFDDFQYFESDDKDLYRSKIKYIEETDPEDLALVFAEEECDRRGRLVKVRQWTFFFAPWVPNPETMTKTLDRVRPHGASNEN